MRHGQWRCVIASSMVDWCGFANMRPCMHSQVADLQQQLSAAQSAAATAQRELDAAKEQAVEAREAADAARRHAQGLDAELADLTAGNAESAQGLQKLRDQVGRAPTSWDASCCVTLPLQDSGTIVCWDLKRHPTTVEQAVQV